MKNLKLQIFPRREGNPEYEDLWLRSRLHGYTTLDPNDVRGVIEQQPIPLKSIKIPIQQGLLASWAPNGYGKTYIFNHLSKKGKSLDSNDEWMCFRNIWDDALHQLGSENLTNPVEIVPYHALGLVVERQEGHFAVIIPTGVQKERLRIEDIDDMINGSQESSSPDFVYVRKLGNQSSDVPDHDEPASLWAYAPEKKWSKIQVPFNDSNEYFFTDYNPEVIAKEAINEYNELSVIYHETPQ